MAQSADLEIRDNPREHRYETVVDGQLAKIDYLLDGDTITFIYTEVPKELEGRGIASQLARFVLDDSRARGRRVVARCPFVASYIRRHPEYQELIGGQG